MNPRSRQHATQPRPVRLLLLAGIVLVGGVVTLTVWTTPPGWLLPARQQTLAALGWAREHWLTPAALAAAAAVAGVLAPFVLRRLDRHRTSAAPEPARQARERAVMLRRVRHKWVTGVLEPSLAQAARLALGLQHRGDVLDLDLGIRARRQPGGKPRPVPPGTPVSAVFDEAGGGLLILGAPGAGKTTLLLELARDLLDRAEHDPAHPIPVVVNLASWARQRLPLAAWLVEELMVGYAVPERTARAWVEADALVLLLDGLDEVAETHRAACATAVNAYRHQHGLVQFVVCSRTQEFQALSVTLGVEEAVEVQPPSDAQLATYLDHLEATGTPLADVRAALAADPELRALLRSPLLLHVMALAYHGQPAVALRGPGTLAQRRALLWEAYVGRMFAQRPLPAGWGSTPEQARDWLSWLARALRDRDLTEFQLDRLALDWLPAPAQRRARVATRLVVGLPVGLAFGLVFGLSAGPPAGLIVGLVFGWSIGQPAGLAGDPLKPVEELRWSWAARRTRPPAGLLAVELVAGLLLGLVVGLSFWVDLGPLVGLAAGLLALGLVLGVLVGLTGELREERTTPNEGIRRSMRHAVVVGLPAGLAAGSFIGLLYGPPAGLAAGVLLGLPLGLTYGGAAVVQHQVVRALLVRERAAPRQYGEFLEAMAERLLLRRSGSAYLFTHRLLRDYLAELAPAVRQRLPTAGKR